MLAMFNGQERTLGDFLQLFEGSGWKLQQIIRPAPAAPPHLVLIRDEGR
jgi:hypothetical protein